MIRVESIWLACGVSDLRAGMDTLLARVVRGFEGGAQMNTAYVFAISSRPRHASHVHPCVVLGRADTAGFERRLP